ncbi:MAG TPA: hypothetical protein VGC44_00105, partial [Longimicrobiales bacterium]
MEGTGVAPQHAAIYSDFFVAAIGNRARSQRPSQEMKSLAQSKARTLVVEFRPEDSKKAIAAAEPIRGSEGEVGKESKALGLRQHRTQFGTGCIAQIRLTKKKQTNHRTRIESERVLSAK